MPRLHPPPVPAAVHDARPAVHPNPSLAHHGRERDLSVGTHAVHTTVTTVMIMNRYDEEHCIDTAPRRAAGPLEDRRQPARPGPLNPE